MLRVIAALVLANRVLTSQTRRSWLLSAVAPALSHAVLYETTGEFLLSAAVLYQLRVVEVVCGPAKYGGLLVLCAAVLRAVLPAAVLPVPLRLPQQEGTAHS